jgi:hypothetical protein
MNAVPGYTDCRPNRRRFISLTDELNLADPGVRRFLNHVQQLVAFDGRGARSPTRGAAPE